MNLKVATTSFSLHLTISPVFLEALGKGNTVLSPAQLEVLPQEKL